MRLGGLPSAESEARVRTLSSACSCHDLELHQKTQRKDGEKVSRWERYREKRRRYQLMEGDEYSGSHNAPGVLRTSCRSSADTY